MDWARLRNVSNSGVTCGFLAGSLAFQMEPSLTVSSARDFCWNCQIAPVAGWKIPANSSRLASSADDDGTDTYGGCFFDCCKRCATRHLSYPPPPCPCP